MDKFGWLLKKREKHISLFTQALNGLTQVLSNLQSEKDRTVAEMQARKEEAEYLQAEIAKTQNLQSKLTQLLS